MSGVKFILDPTPQKKKPSKLPEVPSKEPKLVDIEFNNNSYFGIFDDGEKRRVSVHEAETFFRNSPKLYIPKGYTKKDYEPGHKVSDIKNVLFHFMTLSLVKLYVGRKCLVEKDLALQFEASLEGDSIDRGVDQPWNDRTVHKLEFSSIAKIIRIGARHTARVLTNDGFEVVISKADALAFRAGEAQRGADALAEFGIVIHKKKPDKAKASIARSSVKK